MSDSQNDPQPPDETLLERALSADHVPVRRAGSNLCVCGVEAVAHWNQHLRPQPAVGLPVGVPDHPEDRDALAEFTAATGVTVEELQAAVEPAAVGVPDEPPELPSAGVLAEAMQEAWNDWCSDTGCVPDSFRIEGKAKVYADFSTGGFAECVIEALRRLAVGVPETTEPDRYGCPCGEQFDSQAELDEHDRISANHEVRRVPGASARASEAHPTQDEVSSSEEGETQ